MIREFLRRLFPPADPNDPHRGCTAWIHNRVEHRVNGRLEWVEERCPDRLCYKTKFSRVHPERVSDRWVSEADQ